MYKLQVDHGQQRDSYERFTLKIQNWCKRQVHEEHLLSQRANEVWYDHTLAFRTHHTHTYIYVYIYKMFNLTKKKLNFCTRYRSKGPKKTNKK